MTTAKSKIVKKDSCKLSVSFEIDKQKVQECLENTFSEIQKNTQLPGFRVGKTPMELIKKEFAQRAQERMIQKLSTETIFNYVQNEKIKTAAAPVITNMSFDKHENLLIAADIENHPEISAKNYKKIKLNKKIKNITDVEVDAKLNMLREKNATLSEDNDGIIAKDSYAIIDYELFVDEKKIENGGAQNFMVDISNPANIKGLNDALIAARVDEKKNITIEFPKEHPNKALSGKTGRLHLVVKGIKKKLLPEINDEFAKDIGIENLQKLRGNIKSSIIAEVEKETNEDLKKQIESHLLKQNVFDVPETLVSEHQKSMLESMKNYMLSKGMKEADWDKDKQEWEKKSYEEANDSVRIYYIYENIASIEKLSVTDEEIDKVKGSLAKYYEKNLADFEKKWKDGLSQLKYEMLKDKVIKFLINEAKITETRS